MIVSYFVAKGKVYLAAIVTNNSEGGNPQSSLMDFEKLEYKPIPVRDLLVKMKDESELMIDLAYSAALFDDRELAEEVMELEYHVDELAYLLDMSAMVAARGARDAEALIGVPVIAAATDKISDAAADVAAIVLRGIKIHPIVREAFERVEERLIRTRIRPSSSLVSKRVGDLKFEVKAGVDIIAIRRGKKIIINPSDEELLLEEDILIARGAPLSLEELKAACEVYERPREKAEVKTTISKEVFEKIVEKLVILKDTSELMLDLAYSSILLDSYEIAKEVAALEEYVDDLHTEFELSVLSSGFSPGESKDFLGLIRLGLATEKIADAAAEIANVVLRGLEPHPILRVVIEGAEEVVVKAQVTEGSSLVGKTLSEAQVHERIGMWILAIRRGDGWIRPKPTTKIQAGDILIASGYAKGEDHFIKLVTGA